MYSVLIDTTNRDFIFLVLKGDDCVYKDVRKDYLQKSELLPSVFENALNKLRITVAMVTNYYVTKGPGSFTGSRIGLTFAKTLVQLSYAKLFVADSLSFIAQVNPDAASYVALDARSNQVYLGFFRNQKMVGEIKIVSQTDYAITPYPLKEIEENPWIFLKAFKFVPNALDVYPIYVKNPLIIKKEY